MACLHDWKNLLIESQVLLVKEISLKRRILKLSNLLGARFLMHTWILERKSRSLPQRLSSLAMTMGQRKSRILNQVRVQRNSDRLSTRAMMSRNQRRNVASQRMRREERYEPTRSIIIIVRVMGRDFEVEQQLVMLS